MRTVTLLGSTGSIGTQALDVIAANPDDFHVYGLASTGADPGMLAAQALAHGAQVLAVTRPEAGEAVAAALLAGGGGVSAPMPELLVGPDATRALAARPVDVCLNAVTGSIGLAATLAALEAGSTLALANKESLIAGSTLVTGAAKPGQIVPVDSEHSALAQCLRGGRADEVARLVLTASGGPFRGKSRADLDRVTLEQALTHPTWAMGPMNTLNSATLVNKGLELIEAHLLFAIDYASIDVVVHPQSIVHSMVEFKDGSTLAQLSPPDMRLPIALALAWPDRVAGAAAGMDWTLASTLEFAPLDDATFPAVALARAAGLSGGLATCAFNAANEEAVSAFVAGKLKFSGIVETVALVVDEVGKGTASSLDEVLEAEAWARRRARELAGVD